MSKDKKPSSDHTLKIGENVMVDLGENHQVYPTLLEDITEDAHLIISAPFYRGYPVSIHEKQLVQLYFYRDSGRYAIETQAVRVFMHKHLRLIKLAQLSPPVKQQRRNYYRLPVAIDVSLRLYRSSTSSSQFLAQEENAPGETAHCNNISETGVSVYTHSDFKRGDYVYVKMTLEDNKNHLPLEMLGIIRQKEDANILGTTYFRLGIEFLPYPEQLRRDIVKFILKKQQHALLIRVNTLTDESEDENGE